jgi:hypothetical protein
MYANIYSIQHIPPISLPIVLHKPKVQYLFSHDAMSGYPQSAPPILTEVKIQVLRLNINKDAPAVRISEDGVSLLTRTKQTFFKQHKIFIF